MNWTVCVCRKYIYGAKIASVLSKTARVDTTGEGGRTGTALAHPPTTPIPHARPVMGYICGLWVPPPPPLCVNLPSAKTFFIAPILL